MAERIIKQYVDDLDGAEIPEGKGERLSFGVRGTTYQIDLSPTNVAKFDKALRPFIEAATKVRATGRRGPARKSDPKRSSSREQLQAIREWARQNGYEVSSRGRISADIMEAFEAAH